MRPEAVHQRREKSLSAAADAIKGGTASREAASAKNVPKSNPFDRLKAIRIGRQRKRRTSFTDAEERQLVALVLHWPTEG